MTVSACGGPMLTTDTFPPHRSRKTPVVIVEQNAFMAMSISDRTYVLEVGHIVGSGPSQELLNSPDIKKAYLGG